MGKEVEKILPNPELPREQCVEKCDGCEMMFSDNKIGDVCIAYISPKAIQRLGCALQSNSGITEKEEKKKINPIKMSKRAIGK